MMNRLIKHNRLMVLEKNEFNTGLLLNCPLALMNQSIYRIYHAPDLQKGGGGVRFSVELSFIWYHADSTHKAKKINRFRLSACHIQKLSFRGHENFFDMPVQ